MLLWVVFFCSVKVTFNCVIMIGQYPQSHKVIEGTILQYLFSKTNISPELHLDFHSENFIGGKFDFFWQKEKKVHLLWNTSFLMYACLIKE